MEETEGRGRLCSVTAREPPGRLDSKRLLNSRRAPSQFRSGTSCGGDGGGGATFRRPSQDDLREKKGGRGQKDKRQMTVLIILTSVLLWGQIQTETDPSLSFFRLLHFSGNERAETFWKSALRDVREGTGSAMTPPCCLRSHVDIRRLQQSVNF